MKSPDGRSGLCLLPDPTMEISWISEDGDTPSDIQSSSRLRWLAVLMSAGRAAIHRSSERSESVLFRMAPADKQALKRRASECGVTVQAYLERVALGRTDACALPSGPRQFDQGELPMTG